MNIWGNVIHPAWFHTIVYKGRPNLLAINILADVVYWYRPTYERDEDTGRVTSIHKKFRADKLQKSYSTWAAQFGVSRDRVKNACDLLVALGLITREFRDVIENGNTFRNRMYIEPVAEKIEKISAEYTGVGYKSAPTSPKKVTPRPPKNMPHVGIESGEYTRDYHKRTHKSRAARAAPEPEPFVLGPEHFNLP
jgi:DNA-binding transcriptional MocR family regulator